MTSLFLGLTAANLLVLAGVFGVGLITVDANNHPTSVYVLHITLGTLAGLLTALVHSVVFTYFMATTKWLAAATDKTGLDPSRFATPAQKNKSRILPVSMAAVVLVMLAMFAGAGADPTVRPWWPGGVHLGVAIAALAANVLCALAEYRLIRAQQKLMDDALAILNATPNVSISRA